MIDSHAHLEMKDFDQDRSQAIARAQKAGVETIITVGTNLADCRKAIQIAEQYAGVYAAVGIHPHDACEIEAGTYDALRVLARQKKVVAWGEIGLDFFRNRSPRAVQLQRFQEQLELAQEADLPVIIHDREAHAETLAIIKGWHGRKRGIIHCFSGDWEMARECLDQGFYLSVAGPVTYPKNDGLREIVCRVPLERLLVETDAPYLSPQTLRGKRNEPAYVVHTARKVAEIKGIDVEELARATSRNAGRVFGLVNSLAIPETKG